MNEQYKNKVIQGDCLEELKTLEDNSVDSIVTDPPYELGFMGKSWDNTGIANNVEMWKECLRVLKPGGHLLAFSGTRTYHRMTVAIEDAGFEVRDMIEWVYGQGFPKSLNIGKAVDKLQGNEREEFVRNNGAGTSVSGKKTIYGSGLSKADNDTSEFIDTKGTSEWEGWGTALKPAHEPICMARKPLAEKTVAENCLKWGTGGINIDESRVESKPRLTGTLDKGEEIKAEPTSFKGSGTRKLQTGYDEKMLESNLGRFPANLILSWNENEYIIKESITNEQKQKALKWIYENA
jgi:site-specific DNA-methyltransferase (adenine-specific)